MICRPLYMTLNPTSPGPNSTYDYLSSPNRLRYQLIHLQPGPSGYSVPSATANDIKSSPYLLTWADLGLKSLFERTNNSTNSTDAQPDPSSSVSNPSTDIVAIAGGVVGGVAGVAIILAIIFFIMRKRRRDNQPTADRKVARQCTGGEGSQEVNCRLRIRDGNYKQAAMHAVNCEGLPGRFTNYMEAKGQACRAIRIFTRVATVCTVDL